MRLGLRRSPPINGAEESYVALISGFLDFFVLVFGKISFGLL